MRTHDLAGAGRRRLAPPTAGAVPGCLRVRPCCPTASPLPCTQTPIPTRTGLQRFCFWVPFWIESFQNAVVGAVCSKDHSPWAVGRRQPGRETLGITCSLWLYLWQRRRILNEEPYHYPLLPSGERDEHLQSVEQLPISANEDPLMKVVRSLVWLPQV